MNQRRIHTHLQNKFNDWTSSITDPDLRARVSSSAFFAGGCITSLLLGDKVNDYDVYLRDVEVAADLAQYYVDSFSQYGAPGVVVNRMESRVRLRVQSAGVAIDEPTNVSYQYFEQIQASQYDTVDQYVDEVFARAEDARERIEPGQTKYRPVFMSDNAITLSDQIQIIDRFIGSPRDVIRNFDFVHCTNYWTPQRGLYLYRNALTSTLTKELRYVGSRYPVCSLFRLRKFLSRGWTITAGQILKIALQISDLNLDDVSVLEDQLIGVDVAYFMEVLDAIKTHDDARVDRAYLLQIIDEIM